MSFETYLISLNEGVSHTEVEHILKFLTRVGGNVNMVVNRNIIASFDSSHVDTIRKKPGVRLVGGVNFKGHKVRKIVKRQTEV